MDAPEIFMAKISLLGRAWCCRRHQLHENTLEENAPREQNGFEIGQPHWGVYIKSCVVFAVMAGLMSPRSTVESNSSCVTGRHQKRTWDQRGYLQTVGRGWMLLSHTAGIAEDWRVGGWGERGDRRYVRSLVLVSVFPLLFCSLSWSFHPYRHLGSLQHSCLECHHPSLLWHVMGLCPAVQGRTRAPSVWLLLSTCLLAGLLAAWGSAVGSCWFGTVTSL